MRSSTLLVSAGFLALAAALPIAGREDIFEPAPPVTLPPLIIGAVQEPSSDSVRRRGDADDASMSVIIDELLADPSLAESVPSNPTTDDFIDRVMEAYEIKGIEKHPEGSLEALEKQLESMDVNIDDSGAISKRDDAAAQEDDIVTLEDNDQATAEKLTYLRAMLEFEEKEKLIEVDRVWANECAKVGANCVNPNIHEDVARCMAEAETHKIEYSDRTDGSIDAAGMTDDCKKVLHEWQDMHAIDQKADEMKIEFLDDGAVHFEGESEE